MDMVPVIAKPITNSSTKKFLENLIILSPKD